MSEGSDLAERFVSAIKRKGTNPRELFEEYDRANKGTITMDQFEKMIRSVSFFMNRNELQLIKKLYCQGDVLNYKLFCLDISPSGSLTQSRSLILNQQNLQKVSKHLSYLGMTLYDYVREIDENHNGKLQLAVFQKAIGGDPIISSIIMPYYNKSTDEVNYVQMQRDIDNVVIEKKVEQISGPLPDFFPKFVSQVNSRSIQLYNEFEAHDTYKQGKIPNSVFLSTLGQFGLPLSPYQLQSLMKPFITSEGVNYIMFCDEVNKATPPEPESQRDFDFSSPLEPLLKSIRELIENRHIHIYNDLKENIFGEDFFRVLNEWKVHLSQNDRFALIKAFMLPDKKINVEAFLKEVDPRPKPVSDSADLVVKKLKKFLEDTNRSLVTYCVNFDREKSHTITSSQLLSILNSIRFPVSNHEVQQICHQFGNGTVLNYSELCKQIESKNVTSETTIVFNQPETPTGRVRDLLAKVYNASKQHNISLRGDFARSDPRKRGVLPLSLFRDVLGELPINVASNDMCTLVESYTDSYTKNVYYNKFCDDVDSIGSTTVIKPLTTNTVPDTKPQASFVDSIRNKIIGSLKRLAVATKAERLSINDLFSPHDPSNSGFVETNQVRPLFKPLDKYLEEKTYTDIFEYFVDKRMPEKFSYKKLDAAIYETPVTESELKEFAQSARIKLHPDAAVSAICNAIRARLATRRKRIDDLFLDVTKDTISEHEFRQHLSRSGILLEENEIIQLIWNYQIENGKDIKWRQFCYDVTLSKPVPF